MNDGDRFSASLVVTPYVSARSFALAWNPSDSGFIMEVERVVLNHAGPGADGFDFRKAAMSYGTFLKKATDKNFAISNPSAFELRYGNAPMTNLPTDANIVHEAWQDAAWRERDYFPGAMCPPGMGLMICAANDNRFLIATFHLRATSLPQ